MRESLTYGTVGGSVEKSLILPGQQRGSFAVLVDCLSIPCRQDIWQRRHEMRQNKAYYLGTLPKGKHTTASQVDKPALSHIVS